MSDDNTSSDEKQQIEQRLAELQRKTAELRQQVRELTAWCDGYSAALGLRFRLAQQARPPQRQPSPASRPNQ